MIELLGKRVLVSPKKVKKSAFEVDKLDLLDTSVINEGTVLVIGSEVEKVFVGEKVLIEAYQSHVISFNGEQYFYTLEENIIGKL